MDNDPAVIDEMLSKARTIAVVGMSDKPWRASHNIGKYLACEWIPCAAGESGAAGGCLA